SSLALAGDDLVVGGDGRVSVIDARSGTTTWTAPISGQGHGLAIAGGSLLVSTDQGVMHAFRAGPPSEGRTQRPIPDALPENWRPELLELLQEHGMDRGVAVVVDPIDGFDALMLADSTDLHVIVLDTDESLVNAIRSRAADHRIYGDRLVAHVVDTADCGIVGGMANVLISERGLRNGVAACTPGNNRLVRPNGGLLILGAPLEAAVAEEFDEQFIPISCAIPGTWKRTSLPGSGDWTHPYADAGNSTASRDTRVGTDTALQWFGGPGPARMVDRHLRTTSSLAHGGRMFIPGNDTIIAVDAYNGTELWEVEVPGFTRTGAPYDGGWWAISQDGLFAAAGAEAIRLDPRNGRILHRYGIPQAARLPTDSEWGWLALSNDLLLGSTSIAGSTRREQSRDAVVEQYQEHRPLVTSEAIFALDPADDTLQWVYRGGPIPNASIAVDDQRVYLVESRQSNSPGTPAGRIGLGELRQGGLDLVALDLASGKEAWRVPVNAKRYEHSLYLALGRDSVVLTGCTNSESQNQYHVSVHDAKTGAERWHAMHPNNRSGTGGDHGEQVHHPVILENLVIAEPLAYDLATGEVADPTGQGGFIIRSRGGCGTISASASCLFFRDGNPTAVDLSEGQGGWEKLTHSSRPGCWVNVIPAQGLILMPESSAGCVCGFSLQTSMALVPIHSTE
ncbi:MAG: PQQ-like beta-propeller repeat protein, partial [Phycisphaerales bacterium]|nr:PQQ-like beta-propeller repeat protein [Phycisphaerales bacterium]